VNDGYVEVRPTDSCDRCGHKARQHHQRWESYLDKWHCRARIGTDTERQMGREKEVPIYCPCDGFIPAVATA
jgi:hypothetical protein